MNENDYLQLSKKKLARMLVNAVKENQLHVDLLSEKQLTVLSLKEKEQLKNEPLLIKLLRFVLRVFKFILTPVISTFAFASVKFNTAKCRFKSRENKDDPKKKIK